MFNHLTGAQSQFSRLRAEARYDLWSLGEWRNAIKFIKQYC